MGSWIFYFACILLNLLLLVWWRRGTEWDTYGDEITFPSRGHVLLGFIFSLVPIWSAIQFVVLAIWYIIARCEGDIVLKKNKFNHYWFGIELDEDKD